MTFANIILTDTTSPKKRGPKTPEGKARSKMNALKHGLRAREFAVLPEESRAEWDEHVADLRAGYRPVDSTEEKLVAAIAVAMWNEIRADRSLAQTIGQGPVPRDHVGETDGAETPPRSPGLQDPERARSLGTAIRYMTAAGLATQRAQRALLAYRKAKQAGLILPASEPAQVCHGQDGTIELPAEARAGAPRCASGLPGTGAGAVPTAAERTNE
jgi:hypothetical protein